MGLAADAQGRLQAVREDRGVTPDDIVAAAEALAAARAFIEASRWQFARSQPYLPHEYTLREWHDEAGTIEDFLAMVERIRDHGEWLPFGKKRIVCYLIVDGWRYWTMRAQDEAPEEWTAVSTIINRAEVTDEGNPKYGPKWLTGKAPERITCCALGAATGGAHHGKMCDRDQLSLAIPDNGHGSMSWRLLDTSVRVREGAYAEVSGWRSAARRDGAALHDYVQGRWAVAEALDGTLVGCGCVWPLSARAGRLSGDYVVPAFRHQGIITLIVNQRVEWAREMGWERVEVRVRPRRIPADLGPFAGWALHREFKYMLVLRRIL